MKVLCRLLALEPVDRISADGVRANPSVYSRRRRWPAAFTVVMVRVLGWILFPLLALAGTERQTSACTRSRAVVHVGPYKTGTSNIQGTLDRNRERLLELNIRYPATGSTNAHHFLKAYLTRGATTSELAASNAVLQEIANASSCETVLLSSEALASVAARLPAVLKPRRALGVMFFRNVKAWVVSQYQQQMRAKEFPWTTRWGKVRAGKDSTVVDTFRNNLERRPGSLVKWFDHLLAAGVRAFGEKSFILVDFDAACAHGDLADGLLAAAGLPTLNAKPRRAASTSMHDEPSRQLFIMLGMHARVHHGCTLRMQKGKSFKQNFTAFALSERELPLTCSDLKFMDRPSIEFDTHLRSSHKNLFARDSLDPAFARRAIADGHNSWCDLDVATVSSSAAWRSAFDEQLAQLPPWMTCKKEGS